MQTLKHAEPTWLTELRAKAAADFASAPEPSFKYGLHVFVNPKDVRLPFDAAPAAEPATVHAPQDALVLPLEAAFAEPAYAERLAALFNDYDLADKMLAWHAANATGGTLIHAHAGKKIEEPVTIDVGVAGARFDRIVVVAEPLSEITVVERASSKAANGFRSTRAHVIAAPGAKVHYVVVQNADDTAVDLADRRASVGKDASVVWVECVLGGAYARSRIATRLEGEGASVGAKTLFFGRGAQKFDLYQEAHHLASRTHADLRSRGALAGTAKAITRGLVRVEKGTAGCVGDQKQDAVLLGARAEADAIPMLEIAADDVRCGHGASVGRLDREQLFYLMSRGLDEDAARKFLVQGFFAPVIAAMRDDGLVDMVQCLIDDRLADAETPVMK